MRMWDEQVDREVAARLGVTATTGSPKAGTAASSRPGSSRAAHLAVRLGDIVLWAVLVLSLLLLALALAARVTSNAGMQWMVVVSNSMAPVLRTGDLVAVRPAARDQIRVGDIVTYEDAHNTQVLVTHRVIAVEASGADVAYRVKGDNNPIPDPERVTYARIAGKVAAHLPLLGYLVRAMQNRPGLALVAFLPSLVALVLSAARRLTGAGAGVSPP